MKKIHLVIQEGGSSSELYVHAHNTLREATKDMNDCDVNGAYRTVGPITLPKDLTKVLMANPNAETEFYEVVEEALCRSAQYLR